jgi:hypothetical protein
LARLSDDFGVWVYADLCADVLDAGGRHGGGKEDFLAPKMGYIADLLHGISEVGGSEVVVGFIQHQP